VITDYQALVWMPAGLLSGGKSFSAKIGLVVSQ
jgi:hypothetical protein